MASDERQIHRTLTRLRDTTMLPLTFGGPVHAGRQVRFTQFAGSTTGALRGVAVDFGLGLGGKVIALRRPLVVNDYLDSARISHHYDHVIQAEGLRAMAAVPVIVRQNVRGVLYGAIRTAVPLGDRIVRSVVEAARDLEQSLAVHDEVTCRLDWLNRQQPGPSTADPATPERELVREAFAELRILAKDLDDALIRRRVEAVCAKLSAAGDPASRPAPTPTLSAREIDVLACVALGSTNAQVAEDLGISIETVKSYLRSASRKLRSHSRLEAVVTARRLGILP